MSSSDPEDLWRGTSDSRAALLARASTTPEERLAWLEESLLLAQASGALARDRARRQRWADAWAAGPTAPDQTSIPRPARPAPPEEQG